MTDVVAFHSLLRQDLPAFIQKVFHELNPAQTFVPGWHINAIAHHLAQVANGSIKRLIITVPPRGLKSLAASVAFPAWLLGHNPSLRVISVSYAESLAAKFAGDSRRIMRSGWYQDLFPGTVISRDKNTETEILTTAGGGRLVTSVGGTLTGRGGNIIIIDDPLKPEDAYSDVRRQHVNEWFQRTLFSRLDDKQNDSIVIIMQRLHADDLVGHLLQHPGWNHLCLPAIADLDLEIPVGPGKVHRRRAGVALHPAREPLSVLEEIKANLGSATFQAQYQQAPVPPDGEIVRLGWFKRYTSPPPPNTGYRFQSWDTAVKGEERHDYSVCTTWMVCNRDYYLLDVFRQRLEYPDLKRAVVQQAQKYGVPTVLVEDAGLGAGLVADLRRDPIVYRPNLIPIVPEGDKVTRLSLESAAVEAGRVWLPREAPWLGAFLAELLQFPQGRFDDQVDSFSQFLTWIARRSRMQTSQRGF